MTIYKLLFTEKDFEDLITGKIITKKLEDKTEVQIAIALQDIGYWRMLEIITFHNNRLHEKNV